jgi:hypothetical protein
VALADFDRAIAAAAGGAAPDRLRLGLAHVGRAVSRTYLGRFDDAEADVERALAEFGASPPAPPNAAAASAHFARCQIDLLLGDLDRAHASCSAGIEQLRGSVGPTNIWYFELCAYRAFIEFRRGRTAAAEDLAGLVGALDTTSGDDRNASLGVRFLRALAFAETDGAAEAERLLQGLASESGELAGVAHPDTLRIRLELGAVQLRLGKSAPAGAELAEVARAARDRLGPESWQYDVACLLEARARGGSEAAHCPGAQGRIERRFPASTARPRLLLASTLGALVRFSGD